MISSFNELMKCWLTQIFEPKQQLTDRFALKKKKSFIVKADPLDFKFHFKKKGAWL